MAWKPRQVHVSSRRRSPLADAAERAVKTTHPTIFPYFIFLTAVISWNDLIFVRLSSHNLHADFAKAGLSFLSQRSIWYILATQIFVDRQTDRQR